MTLEQLHRATVSRLTPALGEREARATARLLLADLLEVTPVDLACRGDRSVEPETEAIFSRACERISRGEPPQYVTGTATFMGLDLEVTPATLIPRPETAGLVDLVTDRYGDRRDLHFLDVGTGSGCIVIALMRALHFASATAVDISSEALVVASHNAERTRVNIDFRLTDILTAELPLAPLYDFIVSNPPYIAESERDAMESRVKDCEPITALFVPDTDPLLFYRAIARYGRSALKQSGRLFFEINPLFAAPLAAMLKAEGYSDIEISRDYLGRQRFATAAL